ncbi:MAG: DNA recombination protein RmuC [Sulfurimonas sp.]|uniref:DNA recombination protein RmuC n=1 Tax=Sulfurimonas sp. TaxID=2022749 RepID=UPI002606BABC|nr:DNA recombination protein RmuC [Sulfurimonas sp.]MDD5373117.1 DNA recombination protein RmuC [Sulfurimonas sp.]
MEPLSIVSIVAISTVALGLIYWLKKSLEAGDAMRQEVGALPFLHRQISELKENALLLNQELLKKNETIETLREKYALVREKNSELQANLYAQQANNIKLQTEFNEQGKKLELKLNEIMQNSLEGKLKKFDETSLKSLDTILKPFKENIDSFKKKIEEAEVSSIKKFAELSKEIEQVTKAGMNISQEAQNLTTALKGKKQTQGSWGEMILESVLEYSGLLKNVHYQTQESYKDEQGKTKRPDVIIKLPQERTMIIDSKVSLVDYDNYIRAQSEEERVIAVEGIITAFKNHIDILDSKDYAHYKIGTLQYVFMFIPIEGAFALAVQKDPTLYEYALKKHIAIVNPSTLIVSLRTIYLYWQSEKSNSLSIKLFDEAGKLYDKMVGFADNFHRMGNQIKTLSLTYENSQKQLSEGSGNILGRVENLKKLGARASKTLKDSKIEFSEFDEESLDIFVAENEIELLEEQKL